MKDLVPLKVRIGLKENGHAKYPAFNELQVVKDSGMDWSYYVDMYGDSWKYDSKYGHKEEGPDSPQGMQWGVLLVPQEFADQAVAAFGDVCNVIDEVAIEDFYNTRVTVRLSDTIIDKGAFEVFEIKEKLGVTLSSEEEIAKAKALDIEDETPGLRKNKDKYWADYKQKAGINIVS